MMVFGLNSLLIFAFVVIVGSNGKNSATTHICQKLIAMLTFLGIGGCV